MKCGGNEVYQIIQYLLITTSREIVLVMLDLSKHVNESDVIIFVTFSLKGW